jgi:hypothetical protein
MAFLESFELVNCFIQCGDPGESDGGAVTCVLEPWRGAEFGGDVASQETDQNRPEMIFYNLSDNGNYRKDYLWRDCSAPVTIRADSVQNVQSPAFQG